jgi:hypothetical protein
MTTQKTNSSAVQLLDEQKKRVVALQERRTRVQVRIETERTALAAASAEAMALFGTSDLTALRQLYRDQIAENDRAVMEFMLEVDGVEQQIADIERQIKL